MVDQLAPSPGSRPARSRIASGDPTSCTASTSGSTSAITAASAAGLASYASSLVGPYSPPGGKRFSRFQVATIIAIVATIWRQCDGAVVPVRRPAGSDDDASPAPSPSSAIARCRKLSAVLTGSSASTELPSMKPQAVTAR